MSILSILNWSILSQSIFWLIFVLTGITCMIIIRLLTIKSLTENTFEVRKLKNTTSLAKKDGFKIITSKDITYFIAKND